MGLISRRRRWRSAKPRKPGAGQQSNRRLLGLYVAIAAVFLALGIRLLFMQVLGYSEYRLRAEGNRIHVETTAPYRGLLYDRNGKQVVENVPVWSVSVIPADLPVDRQRDVLDTLQALLGVPSYEMEQKVRAGRASADPFGPIPIKTEVDHKTALILKERRLSLPGVEAKYESTRVYQYGQIMGHILGYTGRMSQEELAEYRPQGYAIYERIGKAGVELTYESLLRGSPGRRQVEVDATGREVREIASEPARAGANLTLSIDADLQQVTSQILAESMAGTGSGKAVAMVMDVRTGEILASVSLPTYNNNLFSYQVDEQEYLRLINNPFKPLLDHGIAEKFAPGSTFKVVTGLAALQEGVATTRTTITSRGSLSVQREDGLTDIFPDWNPSLGALDFYRGVAMSSDVYFYCLAGGHCDPEFPGDGLGSARLAEYARMFGLGEMTGIDLPGETEGLVGDAEWLSRATKGEEQWYTGDTFFMGIGQGYIEATPLQMLRMTAAVANGGLLLKPKVVREVRGPDGAVIKPAGPELVRRVDVSGANLQTMREAMRQAVTQGTANRAAVPGVSIAGKTGTAEFGTRLGAGNTHGRYREHGWMVAFGPYESPEVAVVVFQEEGSGATTAAPTAGRILDYYFNQRPRLAQAQP